MRIVHLGTADNKGGAARAAFQLHQGLIHAGHRSHILVKQRYEERPEIDRLTSMRQASRAKALIEYSGEIQARRYLDLYKTVRERRARRPHGDE